MRLIALILFITCWLTTAVSVAQDTCALPPSVPSLLPNPSLELFDPDQAGCQSRQPGGLPDNTNQANCLTGWQRASLGTTDAWNAFTFSGALPNFPGRLPQPLPSGTGLAGFWVGIDTVNLGLRNRDGTRVQNYREYLASCLVDEQRLETGEEYRLTFSLGFIPVERVEETEALLGSFSPVRIAIYGIRECAQLDFGDSYECPQLAGAAGWELIREVEVSGTDGWTNVDLRFRAAADYAGLAIGGACGTDPGYGRSIYRNYYFIDEIRLNVPEAFEQPVAGPVAVSGQTICDDRVTLTGTESPGASYQWLRNGVEVPGATDRQLVLATGPDVDGRYQLRVSTAAGCALSEEVVIQRPILYDQIADSVALCRVGDTIVLSPNDFSFANRYSWSNGTDDYFVRIADPGQYSVTVSNSCEQRIENFVVVAGGQPDYRIDNSNPTACAGDTVDLSFQSDWYYSFVDWEVIAPTNPNDTIAARDRGERTVSVIVQPDSTVVVLSTFDLCTFTQDTVVLRTVPIDYTASVPTLNCDNPVDTIRLALTDPGGVEYVWTDPAGEPAGGSTPELEVDRPGTYRVEFFDGSRCPVVDSFEVIFDDSFVAGLTTVDATCGADGRASALPEGGVAPYLVEWFAAGDGTPLASGTDSIAGLSATTYEVVVTDGSGCELRETFTIGAADTLQLSARVSFEDCTDATLGQVTLAATGGVGPYTYRLDSLTQSAPLFPELPTGTYQFTVIDSNGCTAGPVTAVVRPPTPFTISLPEEIVLRQGDAATLPLAIDGITLADGTAAWSPADGLSCTDCPQPVARPARTTRYRVTFTSFEGCSETADVLVVIDGRLRYFAPTAFSPNGDNVNDEWRIFFGPTVARVVELRIFDRWGELVWETTNEDPAVAWDGTFRGQRLPPATFVYAGVLELVDGRRRSIGGSVALVR